MFRRDYSFQDLFRWDVAHAADSMRLTHGARARDPAVSPDGRRVAFSRNEHADSVLAVMDAVPDAEPSIVWRGERYDEAYQPAWSPDGTRIAFSAWRKGGYRDILVVELASGKIDRASRTTARSTCQPAWSRGRPLHLLRQRSHRHLEHLRVRHARPLDVAGHERARRRVRRAPVARRQAPRVRGAVAAGRLRHLRAAARSRRRGCRRATTSTTSRRPRTSTTTRSRSRRRARTARSRRSRRRRGRSRSTRRTPPSVQTGGTDAAGLHATRSRSRPTSTTATPTSARRTATRASARTCACRRRAHARRARRLRVDGVSTAVRRGGLGRDRVGRHPVRVAPESSWSLSFDYDVDWFRRSASRPGS